MKEIPITEVEKHFQDYNYGSLKKEVAEVVATTLTTIQKKYQEIINSNIINEVLDAGREKTTKLAEAKLFNIAYKFEQANDFYKSVAPDLCTCCK